MSALGVSIFACFWLKIVIVVVVVVVVIRGIGSHLVWYYLGPHRCPDQWHAITSNSFSRVHECDRWRDGAAVASVTAAAKNILQRQQNWWELTCCTSRWTLLPLAGQQLAEVVFVNVQLWGFHSENLEHEWERLRQCRPAGTPSLYTERWCRGPQQ